MDQLIQNDYIINSKYQLLGKIGEGCFGKIYKVKNKQHELSALKIQYMDQKKNKRSTLLNEITVLNRIKNQKGVTKMKASGKWEHGYYLQMELYKNSLQDQRQIDYSISEINVMAKELLHILKRIHSYDVIHQDLKPHNIMKDDKGNFVLIDFGLSCILTQNQKNKRRGFIGTPRYASLAAHHGQCQTGKDDVQSLLYILAYFYMKKLPWLKVNVSKDKKLEEIRKMKELLGMDFFRKISTSFEYSYEYIMNLSENESVDYNNLISIFSSHRNTFTTNRKKNMQSTRRRSELPFLKPGEMPTILINGPEKDEKEEISKNIISQNFSEMAQDGGLVEILQTLTEKILPSFEKDNEFETMSSTITSSEEPRISNVSKYFKNMEFKNPFISPPQ